MILWVIQYEMIYSTVFSAQLITKYLEAVRAQRDKIKRGPIVYEVFNWDEKLECEECLRNRFNSVPFNLQVRVKRVESNPLE